MQLFTKDQIKGKFFHLCTEQKTKFKTVFQESYRIYCFVNNNNIKNIIKYLKKHFVFTDFKFTFELMKNSDGFLDVKDVRMTVLGLGFKPINSELDVCFKNV